jgi:hypothetical protein
MSVVDRCGAQLTDDAPEVARAHLAEALGQVEACPWWAGQVRRVTALGHWERDARSLTLAPLYANIIHGGSAALAALTVLRSRGW